MPQLSGFAMEQNCPVRLQLKARYIPLLVGLSLLQLLVPYKGWMILLVGLGGEWLLSHLWARSLAHGLELAREMRYVRGESQIINYPEEKQA